MFIVYLISLCSIDLNKKIILIIVTLLPKINKVHFTYKFKLTLNL